MHRIKKDAIFLIDGSYLLYRSYYALRPLRTSKGIPTQAVYGFCRAIKKMLDEFDPKYIALVWDTKGPTFRKEMYEEYKATRQAPPSDLFEQKKLIQEFADSIGLKQLGKAGYEADDLIGSIAVDYKAKDQQVIIVGPDKDLYQLIDDNDVLIFDPFKDKVINEADFKKEKGYGPDKVAFFFSILGDASDNIPGVKGIGKKGAEDLVKQFKSLDDLYENLDKVKKDRTRKLLEESKEQAFLSFKLFSLKHVKLSINKKDLEYDKDNWVNAAPIFSELEFKSLLSDLQKKFGVAALTLRQAQVEREPKIAYPELVEGSDKQDEEAQLGLFDDGGTKKKGEEKIKEGKAKKWKCIIVRTESDLQELIEVLKKSKEFAFDTETTGIRPLINELVGLSFAVNKKEAYYVPIDHKTEEDEKQLEREYVLEQLKPVFEDKHIKKILQNAKFDQLALWHYGVEVNNITIDTLLVANLLRKDDYEKVNLKALSVRYLDETMTTYKEAIGRHKHFGLVPIAQAAQYGAHDSLQTLKLKFILQKELNKEKKLKYIYEKVELPLSQILFKMERFGITLDPDKLNTVGKEIDKDLKHIEKKIRSAIESATNKKHASLNLNSPKQIEHLLFDELELPVIKKSGKGQRSTDQEVLLELSKVNPIPGLIAKYRELAKLHSTYIGPLIKEINPDTKRIHTSFSQTMVATGRLASSAPNLQNIPATSDHGLTIRSCFVAPRGKVFLSADYSQVELRVLAHMSKDKNLIDAFLHGRDIHAQTASQIFKVPEGKITNELRQIGKRINFSVIYGLTPFGLSRDLGIKPSEAKEYIDKYFEQYKGVAKFIEKMVKNTQKDGFTQTWMGRKRYVPGIHEKNKLLFEAAKRIVINTPVQGTSAEIIKMAMIDLDKEFNKNKISAKMVLQIHDELLIELPKDEVDKVERVVKKCMESVVKWEIPFKVAIRTGKNWEQVSK